MAKRKAVKKEIQLRTKRLLISPMSDEELGQLIQNTADEELKKAYQEMLDGSIKEPEKRLWYTAWKICLKENCNMIGDMCFKGPAKAHSVEIGYGLKEEYTGRGYATEAVKAFIDWAFSQEDVYFVEAETAPDNLASKRILEKLAFKPDGTGEEGPRFVLEKSETLWMPIYMCFGLSIGLSLGSASDNMSIGMCLGMGIGLCVGTALDAVTKKNHEKMRQEREAAKNA